MTITDVVTFPTSYAQQRLWFLDQLEPGTSVYNIAGVFRLTGRLNAEALAESLREIGRRHDTLRTALVNRDGQPDQFVKQSLDLDFEVVDLTDLPSEEVESEAKRIRLAEGSLPFDLNRAPLWRVKLLRLSAEDHMLLATMHHSISDGWSFGVFIHELASLYQSFSRGVCPALPPIPCQYGEYAAWQREWLEGARMEEQLSHWRKELAGTLPMLEIPVDRPRPAVQTFRGATQSILLPKGLNDALVALSRREGVTLFMTLLAGFQTLLYRYTGQEDFIIGSPIAGRNKLEIEGLIGFFVNTLALRANLGGDPTFRELLARVRDTALAAYDNQDVPFEKLVEHLQPERSLSHAPLFQVLFQLRPPTPEITVVEGLKFEQLEFESITAKFDLSLDMIQASQGLTARLTYNTDLFDSETILRMLRHYQVLLKGIAGNPQQRISTMPILTEAERSQLLVDWNQTIADYPRNETIHHIFEEQAQRTPDNVAIRFGEDLLTYAQLNARANQLAHRLQRMGVGPDVPVGICMERSLELLPAMLGVLKAGGAYVPLDPGYPTERLSYMFRDAGISVALTLERLRDRIPSGDDTHVIVLDAEWDEIAVESDQNPRTLARSENLAYIIYTSGSTGTPKGVLINHRGVVRLIKGTDWAEFGEDQTFLQFASISFDASALEIWGCLLNGALLVLMPAEPVSLEDLGDALERNKITTLWLTAGLFQQMADRQLKSLQGIRQLIVGGDIVSAPHVRKVLGNFGEGSLIDAYGPTECTVFATSYRMRMGDHVNISVPIGRPIANTEVYILDPRLQPVPIGVAGELYVGGDGLARGYLNQPDLTLEKFILNPFSDDSAALLYKTGDRARYLPDGNIEFLGRLDRQVKIRGFRIEPGEIESTLLQHPDVREVAVVPLEEAAGDQRLIAYVVTNREDEFLAQELRELAKEKLPKYLHPSAFVLMKALPLTQNGKLKRSALPVPRPIGASDALPRNPIEKHLVEIWSELLRIEKPGIEDDFFRLGGHSLLATQLVSRVHEVFQVRLPLRSMFESPTIASMAERIALEYPHDEQQPSYLTTCESIIVPIQCNGSKTPIFIVPGGTGGDDVLMSYARMLRSLGPERPCFGFNARALCEEPFGCQSTEEIARHLMDEIRNLQPKGPYLLAGECAGGIAAFELAQQFRAQGEEVRLLVLMDTECPSASVPLRYRLPIIRHDLSERIGEYRRNLARLEPAQWGPFVLGKSKNGWSRIESALRLKGKQGGQARSQVRLDPQFADSKYLQILFHYRPQRYNGAITLMISEAVYPEGKVQAWAGLAAKGADVYVVPGDHTRYIRDNSEVFARILKSCIEKAEP